MTLGPGLKVCPDFMQYVYFKIIVWSPRSVWAEEGVNEAATFHAVIHHFTQTQEVSLTRLLNKTGNFRIISKDRGLETEGRCTFVQLHVVLFFLFLQRQLIWWLSSFLPVKKTQYFEFH